MRPEVGQEARVSTVVCRLNEAPEEDEAAVILAGTQYLTSVPWERGAVECDQHQTGFAARNQ